MDHPGFDKDGLLEEVNAMKRWRKGKQLTCAIFETVKIYIVLALNAEVYNQSTTSNSRERRLKGTGTIREKIRKGDR